MQRTDWYRSWEEATNDKRKKQHQNHKPRRTWKTQFCRKQRHGIYCTTTNEKKIGCHQREFEFRIIQHLCVASPCLLLLSHFVIFISIHCYQTITETIYFEFSNEWFIVYGNLACSGWTWFDVCVCGPYTLTIRLNFRFRVFFFPSSSSFVLFISALMYDNNSIICDWRYAFNDVKLKSCFIHIFLLACNSFFLFRSVFIVVMH